MDEVDFYIYLALASLGVTGMVYVLLMLTDIDLWRGRKTGQAVPVKVAEATSPMSADQTNSAP